MRTLINPRFGVDPSVAPESAFNTLEVPFSDLIVSNSPGFYFSATPAAASPAPGTASTHTIRLAALYGFSGAVTLSAGGLADEILPPIGPGF